MIEIHKTVTQLRWSTTGFLSVTTEFNTTTKSFLNGSSVESPEELESGKISIHNHKVVCLIRRLDASALLWRSGIYNLRVVLMRFVTMGGNEFRPAQQ